MLKPPRKILTLPMRPPLSDLMPRVRALPLGGCQWIQTRTPKCCGKNGYFPIDPVARTVSSSPLPAKVPRRAPPMSEPTPSCGPQAPRPAPAYRTPVAHTETLHSKGLSPGTMPHSTPTGAPLLRPTTNTPRDGPDQSIRALSAKQHPIPFGQKNIANLEARESQPTAGLKWPRRTQSSELVRIGNQRIGSLAACGSGQLHE